jgi:hypothetical protein
LTATGTFQPTGGSAIGLTGTYDASTDQVSVSGGGFTFTGAIVKSALVGTYTGPSSGAGSFAALPSSTGGLAWTISATFADGGTVAGAFTLVNNSNLDHTNNITNWNVSATGGNTSLLVTFDFTPANSGSSYFPHVSLDNVVLPGQVTPQIWFAWVA